MNYKAAVEAILFSSSEPISILAIKRILSLDEEKISEIISELKKKYNENDESGLEIVETPAGFELRIKPEYRKFASKFAPLSDLSEGMLRTLALIILKHPITQAEIVKIQGNKAYNYIKGLEKKGLIKTQSVKRTKLISLSEGFERYFGMSIDEVKRMIEEKLDESAFENSEEKS